MNLVSDEYFSIVRLSACCASAVSESASSKNIIFTGTLAMDTVLAKFFTSPLITSIPLASLAFSSLKAPSRSVP